MTAPQCLVMWPGGMQCHKTEWRGSSPHKLRLCMPQTRLWKGSYHVCPIFPIFGGKIGMNWSFEKSIFLLITPDIHVIKSLLEWQQTIMSVNGTFMLCTSYHDLTQNLYVESWLAVLTNILNNNHYSGTNRGVSSTFLSDPQIAFSSLGLPICFSGAFCYWHCANRCALMWKFLRKVRLVGQKNVCFFKYKIWFAFSTIFSETPNFV